MNNKSVHPILNEIAIPPLFPAVLFNPAFIAIASTSK